MKKFLSIVALLFLGTSAQAQTLTVQSQTISPVGAGAYPSPLAVYNATFRKPTAKGNTLVLVLPPSYNITVTETGNTWVNPCPGFWTAPALGGVETVTITYPSVSYAIAVLSEYPSLLAVDSCPALAFGNGASTLSNIITTTSVNEFVLSYGWNSTTNYDGVVAGPGFVMEGAQNAFLEDTLQPTLGPIAGSVTWSSSVSWSQGVVSLKAALPAAANIVLTINSTSNAIYDDATAILPGPVVISQQRTPTSTINIGTITSDFAGNLTGSITVNPNLVDVNGNLTFLFGLPFIPSVVSYPVPVGEFQHGSTGLTINLTIFKQGALAIKSQTLAVTP